MIQNLISVIIPYYRSESTIERAISSVYSQTFSNFEIIIVDDYSDNLESYEKLDFIKLIYPDIQIIYLNENGGPAKARNEGWNKAKGEYIAFLDSDDAWHSEKLSTVMAIFEKNEKIYFIGHKTEIIQSGQESEILKIQSLESIDIMKEISFFELLKSNKFSTPTVVLRNDGRYRFNEKMRFSEDYSLWLDIAANGEKMILLDCVLAFLYKEKYGKSGLSSNLMAMGISELKVYKNLLKKGNITFFHWYYYTSYSFLKLIRRIILVKWRKIKERAE